MIRIVLILVYGSSYYALIPQSYDIAINYRIFMPAVNVIAGALLIYYFVCIKNLYIVLRHEANVAISRKNFVFANKSQVGSYDLQ